MANFNWDVLASWVDRMEPLGPPRAEVHQAIKDLRALLGEDWAGFAGSHPLVLELLTTYGGGRPVAVRIRRLLEWLENGPAKKQLVIELAGRSWEGFLGASTVLVVAARLLTAGRPVKLLVPNRSTPTPDFRADLAGRWITFEATALQAPKPEQEAECIQADFCQWAINRRVASEWFVNIDLPLPVCDARQYLPAIKSAVLAQVETGESGERLLPPVIRVRVLKGKGPIPVIVNGLVIERYSQFLDKIDFKRVLRAARHKARQVKGIGPSVIVIRNHQLFALEGSIWPEATHALAERVDAELSKLPDVSAVLDYEEWLAASSPPVEFSECTSYRALRGCDQDGYYRTIVLVLNQLAQHPLTSTEIGVVVGSKMLW